MNTASELSLIVIGLVFGLSVPLVLWLAARVLRGSRALPAPAPALPEPSLRGKRVNVRFLIGALLSLVVLAVTLLLIPLVLAVSSPLGHPGWARAGVLMLGGMGVLALVYASKKGDWDWLRSFRDPSAPDDPTRSPPTQAVAESGRLP